MDAKLLQLKRVALLQDLHDQDLAILAEGAAIKTFPKGAVLMNEGEDSRAIYFLMEGRIRAFVSNAQGKELTLHCHEPGGHFGAAELLSGMPSCASLIATERSKLLLLPNSAALRHFIFEHPQARARLVQQLTAQIEGLVRTAKRLALMDVYQRVATILMDLSGQEDGAFRVTQRLTHQDIASRIGASREMVTHVLKDLVDSDYLRVEAQRIVINRPLPAIAN